ncbi:hypothetical protein SBADM41S_02130 [Streptomyces badius]
MDDYAGRVLADRYRLPLPPSDGYELAETRAFDTYSGQEVLVRQVPLPEIVDAEVLAADGRAPASGRAGGRSPPQYGPRGPAGDRGRAGRRPGARPLAASTRLRRVRLGGFALDSRRAALRPAVQAALPTPRRTRPSWSRWCAASRPPSRRSADPLRPVVESLLRQDPTERPDFEELRGWLRSLVRSAPGAGGGCRRRPAARARRHPAPRRTPPGRAGPATPRPVRRRRGGQAPPGQAPAARRQAAGPPRVPVAARPARAQAGGVLGGRAPGPRAACAQGAPGAEGTPASERGLSAQAGPAAARPDPPADGRCHRVRRDVHAEGGTGPGQRGARAHRFRRTARRLGRARPLGLDGRFDRGIR